MTIGERVRILREARGYTQKELEDASAVPQQTISHVENAEFPNVGITTIQKLADALDADMDWLLGRERFIDRKFPPELAEILPDYEKLPANSRKNALDIFKAVVKNFPQADRAREGHRLASAI